MSVGSNDAVWLDVLPNMSKFGPEMSKGADKEAGKAGKGAGLAFGKAAAAGVAATAAGVALAGKALYDLGATFDDMTDTIRVGTGATGDALTNLVDTAKVVGTQVPASFGDIGTAVADINTRLGHTGKPLEELSSQFLELSRITGTDVATNIEKVSRVFGDWGVSAEDQGAKLDYLFKVSQNTGIGIEDLSSKVVQYGAPFRQYGFTMEESAALMGKWAKEGVNTETVMAGMRAGLGKLSKAGKDPAVAFKEITEQIKNAGSAGEANAIAIETFGQRAGPDMAAAVREGRFDLDELMKTLDSSGETIVGAGADTMDFAEQWTLFANKMSVLVAPIAEKVFGLVTEGMTWINENAIPWIDKMGQAWEAGTGPMGDAKDALSAVWGVIQNGVLPVLGMLWQVFQDKVVPWVEKSTGVFMDTFVPVMQDVWAVFQEKVLPILNDFWKFLSEKVGPTVEYVANNIVLPLFGAIGQTIKFVWENLIKPALSAWYDFLKNYVGPVFNWLWEKVIDPTFRSIGDAIKSFSDNWADVWYGIQKAAAAPVNFIIETVYNNGIRKVLNLIPGMHLGKAATIAVPSSGRSGGRGGPSPLRALREGGTVNGRVGLPWNAANRDPYLGFTPNGMFRFEGEEYIVKRSSTSKMEKLHPGLLDYINSHGSLPGRAGGGRVSLRGHSFTGIFAAALLAAEKMAGRVFRISQGGFRPRTSYSGTSHAGDAVDIVRPYSVKDIVALRSQGIAAWDRAGKGKWVDHIHGVPLPGRGTPGGSAVWQAQDYLRGGDGLGGRDNGPRVGVSGDASGWFQIPGLIKEIMTNVGKMVGPWMEVFKGAAIEAVDQMKKWVWDKIEGIGDGLAELVLGKQAKGYLLGTRNADPGLAMLSENGLPELVVGPQLRRMEGGERVFNSRETRELFGGGRDFDEVTADAIVEALLKVGFPERVRDGVAQGLQRRSRSMQTEVLEG